MNTKLLASVTILMLLVGIVSTPITQLAHAEDKTKKKDVKKDTKKTDSKKKTAKTTTKKPTTIKTKSSPTKTVTSTAIEMTENAGTNTKCNDKCYTPNNIKVRLGSTVTWNNIDSAAHTATASDGSFDSGLVMSGKAFSYKFNTAGTFDYSCTVHPWMKGIVTVK